MPYQRHLLILILLFVFVYPDTTLHAQAPWRSKLIVLFEGPNNTLIPDTVWFGCDSLGADGYQEGLDIYDTIHDYQVTSFDEHIPGKTLKQNIKGFKKHVATSFNLRCSGNARYIVWDSLDFEYVYDTIFMLYAGIAAPEYVSFDIWHKSTVGLSSYRPDFPATRFYPNDTIEILEGGDWELELSIEVKFTDSSLYLNTDEYKRIEKRYTLVYHQDCIEALSEEPGDAMVSLYHLNGSLITQKSLNNRSPQIIDTQILPPGFYLIQITDHIHRPFVKKILKY